MELAKTSWLDKETFQKTVEKKASEILLEEKASMERKTERQKCLRNNRTGYRKTLLVPALIGHPGQKCLRVKTIGEKECHTLRNSKRFEWIDEGKVEFFLGFEPKNLNDPRSYGTLLSYWTEDVKVTKLEMSYRLLRCA